MVVRNPLRTRRSRPTASRPWKFSFDTTQLLRRDVVTSLPLFVSDVGIAILTWLTVSIAGVTCFGTDWNLVLAASVAISIPVAFLTQGLYPAVGFGPSEETRRCVIAISTVSIGILAWSIMSGVGAFSAIATCAGCLVTIPAGRVGARTQLRSYRWWRQPTLVVGDDWEVSRLRRWIRRLPGTWHASASGSW